MILALVLFGVTITASWLGSYIALAIGAMTLFALIKKPGFSWLARNLDEIKQNQKKLTDQFATNGGSSIKDQLNRIEAEQLRVKAELLHSLEFQEESKSDRRRLNLAMSSIAKDMKKLKEQKS